MSVIAFLKISARLCRAPIAFFTAYSAVTGYLLGPQRSPASGILTACAVFILASGASALNQCQERHLDTLMERTRRRPLPAHFVTPLWASSLSLILIIAGLALLFVSSGTIPFILGILAIFWYNGVYTRLKRLTAFAAVPGAVVGMISPAIGWSSAGGGLFDPKILALCFLFFMWQVPHFWIQLMDHGEEYERAGLPSLTSVLRKPQIARMTFTWICAAAISGMLLPLYGAIISPFLYFLLLPGAAWIIISGFKLVTPEWRSALAISTFRMINAYIVFVMSLVSIESLLLLTP